MAADDVRADQCQPAAEHLARAFGFLGKRWTAIILGHLSHGSVGFRDLSRGIGGISDSVLSERLGDLAAGGLITRTVRDGPPVTVTYQLTPGASRRSWPARSAHACSSDVFPLPAAAEMADHRNPVTTSHHSGCEAEGQEGETYERACSDRGRRGR